MQTSDLESMYLPLGERVRIKTKDSSFTGTITEVGRRHFTVQGDMYRQTYLKGDVVTGVIKIMAVAERETA